jgi:hypothetical protein
VASFVGKIKHTFYVQLPFPENGPIHEVMLKSTAEPDQPQMTIWCMRIACWIPKGKNTHSECEINIAFQMQQWLRERASILGYTCTAFSYLRYASITTLWIKRNTEYSLKMQKNF